MSIPYDREVEFRYMWNQIQIEVTATATEKGFKREEFNPVVALALMHGEISEAVEALRVENPPDNHCPDFDSVSVEMADLIIRLMVLAEAMGLDIPRALFAKKAYNKTRPYKHGKSFR